MLPYEAIGDERFLHLYMDKVRFFFPYYDIKGSYPYGKILKPALPHRIFPYLKRVVISLMVDESRADHYRPVAVLRMAGKTLTH